MASKEKFTIKLQKKYKYKKLDKVIKSFEKLKLLEKSKTSKFDQFTRTMRKKSILDISSNLLKELNNVFNSTFACSKSTRVFLSAYLMAAHPNITLSEHRNNLEEEIYKMSVKLVNQTDKLLRNFDSNNILLSSLYMFTFKNAFNQYGMLFSVWQHIDKEGIIEMLATRYHSLKRTIKFISEESKFDDHVKEECVVTLNSQLKDIEKKVKSIDKKFDVEYFKKYSELREKIENNFDKAFWDKMSCDIQKDNFEGVIKHIKKLIDTICSLIPNRKDLHKEIKDKIDIEMIEQLMENRMFSGKALFEYTGYLFDWLKKLSSPSREKDLEKIWNDLTENSSNKEYHLLVPEIFKLLYKILGLIEKDLSLLNN